MQFVSFLKEGKSHVGLFFRGKVLPLAQAAQRLGKAFPLDMKSYLWHLDEYEPIAKEIHQRLTKQGDFQELLLPYHSLEIQAPVPQPTSCRDAYAFRQHVAAARKSRGLEMIPEYDQFPVFYYTNHNAIIGPGPVKVMKDHLIKLDYELEVAAVIGKRGRNIEAKDADNYIYGYMIMNDFSARQLQREEMKLNLGPAKGKDFATALGPVLVTRDELEPFKIPPKEGHIGERYNLVMKAYLNGELMSLGNFADMDWTFAEIIERISYGCDILPGDVIGSGTVGTGCLLEINGTRKMQDPDYEPIWLKEGDVIELEVDFLGKLRNTIEVEDYNYSILAKKKTAVQ